MTITFDNHEFKSGEDYYLLTGEVEIFYNRYTEKFYVKLQRGLTLFKQIKDHPETGIFINPADFESRIEEIAIDKFRELL